MVAGTVDSSEEPGRLKGDYQRSGQGDPSEFSRRRKLIYEVEQALDVELDALKSNRPRITNKDVKRILKALIKDFGYETEVVFLQDVHDREDLERVSQDGGEDTVDG